jgi:hypothetical protein
MRNVAKVCISAAVDRYFYSWALLVYFEETHDEEIREVDIM